MRKLIWGAGLASGLAVAGLSAPVAAQPVNAQAVALCNVDHFAVLDDRVRVKCGRTQGSVASGKHYVMTLNNNWDRVAVYLDIAAAAKSMNKPVRVHYMHHASHNPPKCGDDCRKLVGMTLE